MILTITIWQILGMIFVIVVLFTVFIIRLGYMIVSSYYDNDNEVEIEEDPEEVDIYPYNEEITRL